MAVAGARTLAPGALLYLKLSGGTSPSYPVLCASHATRFNGLHGLRDLDAVNLGAVDATFDPAQGRGGVERAIPAQGSRILEWGCRNHLGAMRSLHCDLLGTVCGRRCNPFGTVHGCRSVYGRRKLRRSSPGTRWRGVAQTVTDRSLIEHVRQMSDVEVPQLWLAHKLPPVVMTVPTKSGIVQAITMNTIMVLLAVVAYNFFSITRLEKGT
jgi:hypothetical protein